VAALPLLSNQVNDKEHRTTAKERTFVEAELVVEDMFAEPDLAVSVQQVLVEIVSYSAAELDFSEHVPHRVPRHTLQWRSAGGFERTLTTISYSPKL